MSEHKDWISSRRLEALQRELQVLGNQLDEHWHGLPHYKQDEIEGAIKAVAPLFNRYGQERRTGRERRQA